MAIDGNDHRLSETPNRLEVSDEVAHRIEMVVRARNRVVGHAGGYDVVSVCQVVASREGVPAPVMITARTSSIFSTR